VITPWIVSAVVCAVALLGVGAWCFVALRRKPATENKLDEARRSFHQRREWLEARFMTLASRSGKPRGLAWVDCDFEDAVSFARDRASGQLRALVGVTIRFRAIEGGGMEDNPNVANLRAATSVFHLNGETWETDGRTLFNLNPSEAIRHFQHELDLVE
jgi:hypothetical protein